MRIARVRFPSGPVRYPSALRWRSLLPRLHQRRGASTRSGHGAQRRHGKEALRPHALYLVNAGLAVLAIDYRTVGSSEGEPRCQWFPERQVDPLRCLPEPQHARCVDGADDPKLAAYVARPPVRVIPGPRGSAVSGPATGIPECVVRPALPVPENSRRATAPRTCHQEISSATADHFDERQLSAGVLMIAFANYANRINATIRHSLEGEIS